MHQEKFKREVVNLPIDESYLWFMEFDVITLEDALITEAKMLEVIGRFDAEQAVVKEGSTQHPMIRIIGESLQEIYQTLLNFFSVESRLEENGQDITDYFNNLVRLLDCEIRYTSFFRTKSSHFRFYRILASQIRLIRYLQFLYDKIQTQKQKFDATFFDNMQEVYLYIQQKVQETLVEAKQHIDKKEETSTEPEPVSTEQQEGEEKVPKRPQPEPNTNNLVRIYLQILNLLINFNGGIIRIVAMNAEVERQCIQMILRSNLTYFQFRDRLTEEVIEVELSQQIDPQLIRRKEDEDDEIN